MSRRSKRRERRQQKRQKPPENISQIADLQILYDAVKKTSRLVRWKQSVQRFNIHILFKIHRLKNEILAGKDIRKGFTKFYIYERGKRREIQSLKFSERIVQSVVCSEILMPRFGSSFIKENTASQVGKGTLFASKLLETHLKNFLRKHDKGYILTIDFSKYFENIQHRPLIDFYKTNLTDEKVKKLMISFITAYDKGLGLGSETSQFNAILYVNKIDHYIKHHFKYYGRYMDDSYIISEDKEKLKEFTKILFEMYSEIGIIVNEKKTKIVPLTQHFSFLKTRYKIVGNKIVKKPSRSSITRARRRFKKMISLMQRGVLTPEEIERSFQAWRGSMIHRHARKVLYKIRKELNHAICLQLNNGRICNDNAVRNRD